MPDVDPLVAVAPTVETGPPAPRAVVPLPGVVVPVTGDTGKPTVTGIDRWATSVPMRELVRHFGGTWPAAADTGSLLAALDDFSARHWDFRGGRERPEAREPELDPKTAAEVFAAADLLGLTTVAPPPRSRYAHLLVLGGLAHACLRRTRYAAHLLRRTRHAAHLLHRTEIGGEVAVLGSFRPLSETERRTLAACGIDGCETEFDVLDAGVRAAFGVHSPVDEQRGAEDEQRGTASGAGSPAPGEAVHEHGGWLSRRYQPAEGPPVRVLAAPSSQPTVRRAHTADTQRFWAEQVRLSPGDPLLMVTAPIYVPFQHCDALRTLAVPYGCPVDTVGVDPDLPDLVDLPEPTLTPGRYLQEIRSAIRSMRALHATLPAPEHDPDPPGTH